MGSFGEPGWAGVGGPHFSETVGEWGTWRLHRIWANVIIPLFAACPAIAYHSTELWTAGRAIMGSFRGPGWEGAGRLHFSETVGEWGTSRLHGLGADVFKSLFAAACSCISYHITGSLTAESFITRSSQGHPRQR